MRKKMLFLYLANELNLKTLLVFIGCILLISAIVVLNFEFPNDNLDSLLNAEAYLNEYKNNTIFLLVIINLVLVSFITGFDSTIHQNRFDIIFISDHKRSTIYITKIISHFIYLSLIVLFILY